MPMLIYNLVFPVLFILYLPFYLVKLARRGGLNRLFWERLGIYTRRQLEAIGKLDRPVWIHAVSVGEAVAAAGFIARWREREPATDFILSTTTTTGHAMAGRNLPPGVALVYCPVDLRLVVRRALRLANPRSLVIFEVEYWPNLITQAAKRGAAVILANGRMSDKSAAGYARHAWFFRPLFRRFSLFCMQSEADVERVRKIVGGAVPAVACSTMKFDQVADVSTADKSAIFTEVFGPGERLIWTAGSTHANEEALIADTFNALKPSFPALKLVLVPRHHERTGDVERVLQDRQISYRLLKRPNSETPPTPVDVLLVNTTGELMGFYGASDIVYVGKSLAGCTGGHNIIEPAIFGKAIIHGPNMQNFRLVAQLFREAGATVEVPEDSRLLPEMQHLCSSPQRRAELAGKARRVVAGGRGAMDRTLDHIAELRNAG